MPLLEYSENPQTGLGGLEDLKAQKLEEINKRLKHDEEFGFVKSSLGFFVDANEKANRNVEGLIKYLVATGKKEILFCDHNNVMQKISLDELKKIQLEIIEYGQSLYAKKWKLRESILKAKNAEDLKEINWSSE